MKKAIFTLAIFAMAFGNPVFAQRKASLKSNEKEIVFRHYGLRNDDIRPLEANWSSVFEESYKTTYMYDEYDFWLVEEYTEVNLGDGWRPASTIVYEYDFSGNLLEVTMSEYDDGEWEEETKAFYSYDGDELSEVIIQFWSGTEWVNMLKEVYNFNGNTSTVLFWEWNGNNWATANLYTYTYSDTSIELLKQYMQGGAWQNKEMVFYTLDFSGNVTEIVEQEWSNNAWVNDEKTIYKFEGGVFTSKSVAEWDGSAWEDEFQYEFVYDDEGNATHGSCSVFSGYEWGPADGDIEMAYNFNSASNEYYGFKAEVTYFDVTALKESTQPLSFKVYPMPAENEVFVQTERFGKAEIYSLTGQKLLENNTNRLNVSALSAGVYLLKVYDPEGNSAAQRIVVK